MRKVTMVWVAAVALMVLAVGSAQAITPKQVLDRAMAASAGVKDYTCSVTVKSNIPNMRLPERKVTVYMKRPNKVRVDSGGQMVMVPRDVLLLGNFGRRVEDSAQLILAGTSKVGGRPVYFIKIVPKPREAGQQQASKGGGRGGPGGQGGRGGQNLGPRKYLVWIWGDNWVVKRTEMWAGTTRMMSADWTYAKVKGFWLPSVIKSAFSGGRMANGGKGSVQLTFSGWKINTGLSDKIFANQPQHGQGFGPGGGGGGQGGQRRGWDRQKGSK